MTKTVIIGAGAMGRRHIQAVRQARDFRLAAICDTRTEALQKCGEECGHQVQSYSDSERMLKEIRPDCAIISTTATSHFPLAMKAIESGVPLLLIEKPLCVSLEQIEQLREAAAKKNIRIAVNHNSRFVASYMKLKELASEPGLGELRSFCLAGGNMGVAMNASHQFELFHFLTGNFLDYVWAWFQPDPWPNPRGAEFQDAAGQLRLENRLGQRQYIEIGPDLGHGIQITLCFEKGQIISDIPGRKAFLSMRRPEDTGLPTTRYAMPAVTIECDLPAGNVVEASSAMLLALSNGGNYLGLEGGERIIRTLVAAYVSNENNHAQVDINGDLPQERKFMWA